VKVLCWLYNFMSEHLAQ